MECSWCYIKRHPRPQAIISALAEGRAPKRERKYFLCGRSILIIVYGTEDLKDIKGDYKNTLKDKMVFSYQKF